MTSLALLRFLGAFIIAMYTLHMITTIPLPRKSIARLGSVAVVELAKVDIHTVSMATVHFTLMSEEASIGRESDILAVGSLSGVSALIWPEV